MGKKFTVDYYKGNASETKLGGLLKNIKKSTVELEKDYADVKYEETNSGMLSSSSRTVENKIMYDKIGATQESTMKSGAGELPEILKGISMVILIVVALLTIPRIVSSIMTTPSNRFFTSWDKYISDYNKVESSEEKYVMTLDEKSFNNPDIFTKVRSEYDKQIEDLTAQAQKDVDAKNSEILEQYNAEKAEYDKRDAELQAEYDKAMEQYNAEYEKYAEERREYLRNIKEISDSTDITFIQVLQWIIDNPNTTLFIKGTNTADTFYSATRNIFRDIASKYCNNENELDGIVARFIPGTKITAEEIINQTIKNAGSEELANKVRDISNASVSDKDIQGYGLTKAMILGIGGEEPVPPEKPERASVEGIENPEEPVLEEVSDTLLSEAGISLKSMLMEAYLAEVQKYSTSTKVTKNLGVGRGINTTEREIYNYALDKAVNKRATLSLNLAILVGSAIILLTVFGISSSKAKEGITSSYYTFVIEYGSSYISFGFYSEEAMHEFAKRLLAAIRGESVEPAEPLTPSETDSDTGWVRTSFTRVDDETLLAKYHNTKTGEDIDMSVSEDAPFNVHTGENLWEEGKRLGL